MSEAVPLVVDLQTRAAAHRPVARRVSGGRWRSGEGRNLSAVLLAAAPARKALPPRRPTNSPTLPMNAAALEAMRQRRLAGGRVVLVTDAPEAMARAFAAALDACDEAIGALA